MEKPANPARKLGDIDVLVIDLQDVGGGIRSSGRLIYACLP
jgi:uncharacterized protein YbbC (DUF1343 family)